MRLLSRFTRSGRGVALGLAAVVAFSTLAFTPGSLSWQLTPTGVDARFRGLSAVSAQVAWAGGSGGTVLRTTDRGRTWRNVSPPGVADLLFRDIEAFDARRAVVLAIGEGEASRIYVTSDGGAHWREAFRNDDPRAFYDCTAFFDQRRGLALSDPVDGRFRILATEDGGRSWRVRPTTGMPAALPGEFAFAASGTCLVTSGPRDAWFATGGGARPGSSTPGTAGAAGRSRPRRCAAVRRPASSRSRSATPGSAWRSAVISWCPTRPWTRWR